MVENPNKFFSIRINRLITMQLTRETSVTLLGIKVDKLNFEKKSDSTVSESWPPVKCPVTYT